MDYTKINFDYNGTKKYYIDLKGEHICDCLYCVNFRKSFSKYYPETASFIESFGLNTDNDLEISEFGFYEELGSRMYIIEGAVIGNIIDDKIITEIEGLKIELINGSTGYSAPFTPKFNKPFFYIVVYNIYLPEERI